MCFAMDEIVPKAQLGFPIHDKYFHMHTFLKKIDINTQG